MGTRLSPKEQKILERAREIERRSRELPETVLPPDPDAEYDDVSASRHWQQETEKLRHRNNFRLSDEEREEVRLIASRLLLTLPSTGDWEKDTKKAWEKAQLEVTWRKTEALATRIRSDQQPPRERSASPPRDGARSPDPPRKRSRYGNDNDEIIQKIPTMEGSEDTGEIKRPAGFLSFSERLRICDEKYKRQSPRSPFPWEVEAKVRKEIHSNNIKYEREMGLKRQHDPWYPYIERPRPDRQIPNQWCVDLVYTCDELLDAKPKRRQAMVLHNEYLRYSGANPYSTTLPSDSNIKVYKDI
ncbi:hypothetical protein TWF696_007689 [Orbilia brochopaga]|uniref:Uncharacterized protein n=1 Tax=Orbilia brochopaga TaxID=3140254 RepID=A0AAV9UPM9_9PEZI